MASSWGSSWGISWAASWGAESSEIEVVLAATEGADSAAFVVVQGSLAVSGGGPFVARPPQVHKPRQLPRDLLPQIDCDLHAVEGADSAALSVRCSIDAALTAAEGADDASCSAAISIAARLSAAEDSDGARMSVAVHEMLADDEIMAILLAEAA